MRLITQHDVGKSMQECPAGLGMENVQHQGATQPAKEQPSSLLTGCCLHACADGEEALADVTNTSTAEGAADGGLPPLGEEAEEGTAAGGGNAADQGAELAALRARVRQLECAQALMERELDAVSAAASDGASQLRRVLHGPLAHPRPSPDLRPMLDTWHYGSASPLLALNVRHCMQRRLAMASKAGSPGSSGRRTDVQRHACTPSQKKLSGE